MQNVAHKVETRDAQPGGSDGTSIVVLVTGMLQVSHRKWFWVYKIGHCQEQTKE